MKSYALYAVLLGIGGAVAVGSGACTVNSTTNNNGTDSGTGDDGSGSSSGASSGGTDSGSSSGGSSSGGSSSGGSSSGGAEAGGDGGVCNNAPTITAADGGPSACDTCMKANCCTELVACDTGTPLDSGLTQCEDLLVNCVLPYPGDGGISEALSACGGGADAGAPADLTTLLTCASAHCATDCQ